jgi:hypothetical protein
VDTALRDSTAKWKIVVGHHTIKSAGHHGVTKELEYHLLPILEVILNILSKCVNSCTRVKFNRVKT